MAAMNLSIFVAQERAEAWDILVWVSSLRKDIHNKNAGKTSYFFCLDRAIGTWSIASKITIWTHPILMMRKDCGGHKIVYGGCLTLNGFDIESCHFLMEWNIV